MAIADTDAWEGATAAARRGFRRGMVASMPVLIGVIPFGLVLGAQAARKGFGLAQVPLLTGLNFAGGSEFAAIHLWTWPPHMLLIAAVTFLVNCRHLLMGAALAPFLRHLPKRKALPALFFMCDESWALGIADARRRAADGVRPAFSLSFYAGAAMALYLTWVGFTTLGAALSPVLGDIQADGFGMAFPAVFLVLLRGMWRDFRSARPWLVSLVVAALTWLIVPGAWYVAAGAVSGVIAAGVLAADA